ATEGWAVNRRLLVASVLAFAGTAVAQVPAARLGIPAPIPPITVRASDPDNEGAPPPPPAARLGTISGTKIGHGPDDGAAAEKCNWGAGRTKGTTTSARDRSDDEGGGARLRSPAPGRKTSNGDEPPPPGPPDCGPDPIWWPGRNRDLEDLRNQFPAFGE